MSKSLSFVESYRASELPCSLYHGVKEAKIFKQVQHIGRKFKDSLESIIRFKNRVRCIANAVYILCFRRVWPDDCECV